MILTALPVEFEAVRDFLPNSQVVRHASGTIYESGVFNVNGRTWNVGIAEIEMGDSSAAFETERAIEFFQPQIILFVGVAGGIKDTDIGDVVVATKIYGYESGKAEETFEPRPQVGLSSYALIQLAKAEARSRHREWLNYIPSKPPNAPRVRVGAIAAGEKVIASKQSSVYQFLREQYGDALAVEMEGYGFLQAVHANGRRASAIVVRGISDLIDDKNSDINQESETIRQKKASLHASAFAFQLLAKFEPLNNSSQEEKVQKTKIEKQIWERLFRCFKSSDLEIIAPICQKVFEENLTLGQLTEYPELKRLSQIQDLRVVFERRDDLELAITWVERVISIFESLSPEVVQPALKVWYHERIFYRPKPKNIFEKYVQGYRNTQGKLESFSQSRSEHISLEKIYVQVRVVADLNYSNNHLDRIDTLGQAVKAVDRLRGIKVAEAKKSSGIEVAKQHQYLVVLGTPGAGKSTFLKAVGLLELKKDIEENPLLPVLIELKSFDTNHPDIINQITQKIEELSGLDLKKSKNEIEEKLENGEFLILLDGLDEIPRQYRSKVLENIKIFSNRYKNNKFIVSCRTSDYVGGLGANFLTKVEIADFDNQRIQEFIGNWFSKSSQRKNKSAEKLWNYLNQPNNSAVKELAKTPLMLTFVCIFYEEKQEIPANRSQLYNEALSIILNKWGAEKNLNKPQALLDLNELRERRLLQKIAFDGFKSNTFKFSKPHIEDEIARFINNLGNNYKNLDEALILEGMIKYQGILRKISNTIYYSFSHLTFQEFLAAGHAYENPTELNAAIDQHIFDFHWRELFILISGLFPESDSFLLKIEERIQTFKDFTLIRYFSLKTRILSDRVQLSKLSSFDKKIIFFTFIASLFIIRASLIDRAEVRDSSLDRRISRRSNNDNLKMSINFMFSFMANKLEAISDNANQLKEIREYIWHFLLHTQGFTKLEKCINASKGLAISMKRSGFISDDDYIKLINLLRKINLSKPRLDSPAETKQAFIRKIQESWFETLGIDSKKLFDNYEEVDQLCHYLNLNFLLFECLHSSTSISRSVRQEILKNAFDFPRNLA